jgi:riboflavin kinase / FMN adenylyltransferase
MNSLSDFNSLTPAPEICLCVGNFDGQHLGHQKLIQELKEKSHKMGAKLALMTFTPHPQKILKPGVSRFLLTSYEERRHRLQDLKIDFLVERLFDRDFSTLKPQEFLDKEIFCYPNLKALFIGHDFSYGENKSGTFQMIEEEGKKRGVKVELQQKHELRGIRFSSSIIRDAVKAGKVDEVAPFLGRSFSLEGLVIKGEGRGKKLGFPTANLQIDDDLIIPARGVYITRTHTRGMAYQSMTNVGLNPTFTSLDKLQVETHLFDFNQDIYGEKIWVEFLQKIREEKKFPSVNELINQLSLDAKSAREFFK